jgi:transposase
VGPSGQGPTRLVARRACSPAAEREELKRLRGEVRELRQANEILKAASVFFAKELDGTPRR